MTGLFDAIALYLAGLSLTFSIESCQFVHASLNAPGEWNYIMRESEARAHFMAQKEPLCFCGHSHVPTVWHLSNTGKIKSWRELGRIELPAGGKTLIAVGSVGQPRDLCPDACYAICNRDEVRVEFHRVVYTSPKRDAKSCARSFLAISHSGFRSGGRSASVERDGPPLRVSGTMLIDRARHPLELVIHSFGISFRHSGGAGVTANTRRSKVDFHLHSCLSFLSSPPASLSGPITHGY